MLISCNKIKCVCRHHENFCVYFIQIYWLCAQKFEVSYFKIITTTRYCFYSFTNSHIKSISFSISFPVKRLLLAAIHVQCIASNRLSLLKTAIVDFSNQPRATSAITLLSIFHKISLEKSSLPVVSAFTRFHQCVSSLFRQLVSMVRSQLGRKLETKSRVSRWPL